MEATSEERQRRIDELVEKRREHVRSFFAGYLSGLELRKFCRTNTWTRSAKPGSRGRRAALFQAEHHHDTVLQAPAIDNITFVAFNFSIVVFG